MHVNAVRRKRTDGRKVQADISLGVCKVVKNPVINRRL